jgi:hypothetical protein
MENPVWFASWSSFTFLPVLALLIFCPTGTRFFAFFRGMIPPDQIGFALFWNNGIME